MEDFNYFKGPPQKRCFKKEFIWENHIKILWPSNSLSCYSCY